MKVGIVTVATGEKYNNFSKILFQSIETHLKGDFDKKICILGDDKSYLNNENLFVSIVSLPRPLTTLLRFYFLKKVQEHLKDCDFVFYFDADLKLCSDINIKEILPEEHNQYVVVKHPWAKSDDNRWILDRNKNSTAYIENVSEYYQGCFFGANTNNFFEMINLLNDNVNKDLNRRYISLWFDESHLNKYLDDKNKKVLSSAYCSPSVFPITDETKIIHYNAHTTPYS